MNLKMKTQHWDAAYKAIAEHPTLSKSTSCAVWIETIGEAVLAAAPTQAPDYQERVEKVAKALCTHAEKDEHMWTRVGEPMRELYRADARAALAAIEGAES